jgi:hypothetical protein
MLKFEFFEEFHVEDNKIKLSFYLIKYFKWFSGEELGVSPEVLSSNLDECVH